MFVNIVPFRNGRMQGERLFFDLPALCAGAGISVDDVLAAAASEPGWGPRRLRSP
jgi:hypothetical protein